MMQQMLLEKEQNQSLNLESQVHQQIQEMHQVKWEVIQLEKEQVQKEIPVQKQQAIL